MNVETEADSIATFDWTAFDSPSVAVVTAVAERTDEDPAALEPLFETVDPDSLDSFLAPSGVARGPPDGSVGFEYHGFWVEVNASGRGYLYDGDHRSSS